MLKKISVTLIQGRLSISGTTGLAQAITAIGVGVYTSDTPTADPNSGFWHLHRRQQNKYCFRGI